MLKTKLFPSEFAQEDLLGLDDLFRSGQVNAGPFVAELEVQLSSFYDRNYCYCFSDMTTAISQLLFELDVKPGDTILCHPFSCLSTTMAIKLVGANVEWIKFDFNKMAIDLDDLASRKTISNILINYNVAGYLPDFDRLEQICKAKSITLINDCNNAELSKFRNIFAPKFGDYCIMSFYPNRWFGAIDGGAILSDNIMRGLKQKQRLGIDRQSYRNKLGAFNHEHDVTVPAGANNMHNLSARIVLNKLNYSNEIRSRTKDTFNLLLSKFVENTIKQTEGGDVIPWLFPIKVENPPRVIETLNYLGFEATELHFLNDRYSVFETGRSKHDISKVLWLPLSTNCLNIPKEIFS